MKLSLAILLSFLPLQVTCSPGDNLDEFWDCRDACEYQRRCPGSPIDWIDSEKNEFASHAFEDTPFVLSKFLFWSCIGDCDYQCQQIITKMRMEQGEEILQFHGKWPFLRLLTMQELFSAVFSMGNFIPHYRAFLKLRSKVARATPAENKQQDKTLTKLHECSHRRNGRMDSLHNFPLEGPFNNGKVRLLLRWNDSRLSVPRHLRKNHTHPPIQDLIDLLHRIRHVHILLTYPPSLHRLVLHIQHALQRLLRYPTILTPNLPRYPKLHASKAKAKARAKAPKSQ